MRFDNGIVLSKKWKLDQISISHNIVNYDSFGTHTSVNDSDLVRLHFGLLGNYDFKYKQLNASFELTGHHNNIMYSDGLELEISNRSKQIETFGINFTKDSFVNIAQNGNDSLKRLANKVVNTEPAILSKEWRPNSFKIQQVINEILHCSFSSELGDLFYYSKSIELLVLQAELYEIDTSNNYITSKQDKAKLFEAKEIVSHRLSHPPTINELSKIIGLNEYKLKKGFKELFGTTVFGYIHKSRMDIAKRLLLDSNKSAKEIAYETGYSSPQHFSKSFKKEFGVTPNSIRNFPDYTI